MQKHGAHAVLSKVHTPQRRLVLNMIGGVDQDQPSTAYSLAAELKCGTGVVLPTRARVSSRFIQGSRGNS
jgi:hypothetical protein